MSTPQIGSGEGNEKAEKETESFPFGKNAERVTGEVVQIADARQRNRTLGFVSPILEPLSRIIPLASFDLSTREGKILAYNAANVENFSISDVVDAEIELVGYYLYVAAMPDEETGENRDIVRAALIDRDGSVYGSSSEGIVRSIVGLSTLFGLAPWSPPIRVIPREKKSKRAGRHFHTLEIVK